MAYAESAPAFEIEFISREQPNDPRIAELMTWCKRCTDLGMMPGSGDAVRHGNISVRTRDGFLISGAQSDKSAMRPAQFVEITGWEQTSCCVRLRCRGRALPSSDALIHHAIYRWRPDVQAVLHGHDAAILAAAGHLDLPSTDRDHPSGSQELARALEPLVRHHDFIVVADHGFLALGASVDIAGRLAESWHRRAASSA